MSEIDAERPPESRVWRNLIVHSSMDAFDGLQHLAYLPPDLPRDRFKAACRVAMGATSFDPEVGLGLWIAASQELEQTAGGISAAALGRWGTAFPADSDAVRPGIDAWSRLWPDLSNRLAHNPDAVPWGEVLRQGYRKTARDSALEAALAERLETPLTDWDKSCFAAYGGEDMLTDVGFFTTIILGSQRIDLACFWESSAGRLDAEAVDLVFRLAKELWAEEHATPTDADFAAMRQEIGDDNTFFAAVDFMKRLPPMPRSLAHPDLLIHYARRFHAFG